jgi:hypothetical protein
MCLPDAMVNPIFSADGKTVVTLSGSFWNALYTVRVWDVSLNPPAADTSKLRFTGKKVPPWLADLADAVAGMRVASEDDDKPPSSLSQLKKTYAGKYVSPEYKSVWDRFFPNGGQ